MTQKGPRQYDAIVIGAGMSGLGAGIRLAMFDKKVLILEKHSISGGLNSYYTRFKRPFDVGLHAMTNFTNKGERRSPLGKLLKQLRIPYDQLQLQQQKSSSIRFPEQQLIFNNDFEQLLQEVHEKFPQQIDGFIQLTEHIKNFNEVGLDNPFVPAKEVVKKYLTDSLLIEMIFSPLLIYGSAWENDMDFSQFAIMFKSIYLEGFCRPKGGVRSILKLLLETYQQREGEIEFRHGVDKVLTCSQGKVRGVLTQKEEVIEAPIVLSSMGYPETLARVQGTNNAAGPDHTPRTGKMTFTESIFVFDQKPQQVGFDRTIVFYNNRPEYHYRNPQKLYDDQSAVVCFPNNFEHDDYPEGIARVTFIADYQSWKELERPIYKEKKNEMAQKALAIVKEILPPNYSAQEVCRDVFSPTTIERYTGHFGGTVYGSPDKSRDGTTAYPGLYLCGTDQGFLGIVGALLSGISMANLHVLSK